MKSRVLRARVPAELWERYEKEAARTGLDVSSLVRMALLRLLPTDEARIEITVSWVKTWQAELKKQFPGGAK